MTMRGDQFRVVGRALIGSAALMFGLGVAFWNGWIAIAEAARPAITMALAVVGVLDLGIGLFFLRRARNGA
jgi:hypothetical protein